MASQSQDFDGMSLSRWCFSMTSDAQSPSYAWIRLAIFAIHHEPISITLFNHLGILFCFVFISFLFISFVLFYSILVLLCSTSFQDELKSESHVSTANTKVYDDFNGRDIVSPLEKGEREYRVRLK